MKKNQEETEVDLKSLVGDHKLSAVWFKDGEAKEWDNGTARQIIFFTLNNKTYKAVEDDNDGYRSSMGSLVLTDETPRNRFKPIKVMCSYTSGSDQFSEDDILQFTNIKTGKLILEVGTHNINDYYPSFVANFHEDEIVEYEECIQNEKDHQGNFKISVSFDVYGESKNVKAEDIVLSVEDKIKGEFAKNLYLLNRYFKVKNIKWNE